MIRRDNNGLRRSLLYMLWKGGEMYEEIGEEVQEARFQKSNPLSLRE